MQFETDSMSKHQRIKRDFGAGRSVWRPEFLSQINEKLIMLTHYSPVLLFYIP